jgi:hypothetical protein
LSSDIQPLFGAQDDEWVTLVGRYILNMGAVELASRLIIARIEGTDQVAVFNAELSARLGFIRKRFPKDDRGLHQRAMNTLGVAERHAGFRNIVAHSPVAIAGQADGTHRVVGIMGLTPGHPERVAEIISLDELRGRVNESSAVASEMLSMQGIFPVTTGA